MQLRALKSFEGRMGYIEHGTVFTAPDGYASSLLRNRLVEVFTPSNAEAMAAGDDNDKRREQDPRRAPNDKSLPGAPARSNVDGPESLAPVENPAEGGDQGNAPGAAPSTGAAPAQDSPQGAGPVTTSSVSRRAQASGKRK